jgi:hypothetical protein
MIKASKVWSTFDAMPQDVLDRMIDSNEVYVDFHDMGIDINQKYTSDEYYYKQRGGQEGDINKDMPILRMYAEEVESVTEFGVRYGTSTSALLAGKPKKLRSYDRDPCPQLRILKHIAQTNGTDFQFIQADTLKVDIEPTDFLFIDTLHTYKQLKAELDRHGSKAKKFIGFHDTEACGERGEDGSEPGLLAAIGEFMTEKGWVLQLYSGIQSGLTIIANYRNILRLKPKDYKNYE